MWGRRPTLASPWSPQQTAAMLTKKHEDTILKMFGMWPFGDLGGSAAEKTKSGGN